MAFRCQPFVYRTIIDFDVKLHAPGTRCSAHGLNLAGGGMGKIYSARRQVLYLPFMPLQAGRWALPTGEQRIALARFVKDDLDHANRGQGAAPASAAPTATLDQTRFLQFPQYLFL